MKFGMSRRKLSEIWVYPIKSLPGIRVKSAMVLEKGLKGDRRFMLIDEHGVFMTQRNYPQMAMFDVSMEQEVIRVRLNSMDRLGTLFITNEGHTNEKGTIKTRVWDDEVEVYEMNQAYSKWFSETLDVICKLVYFPEKGVRRIDPKYVVEEHHVSLADGYPYLIIGTNSLADLNDRVGQSLSMKRFRPNFVFENGTPYEEDGWKNFGIAEVCFSGVKPCARCAIPSIDPETGIKGDEPLRTLATYRKKDSKIYFGQNVIALNHGEIKEGDEIILL